MGIGRVEVVSLISEICLEEGWFDLDIFYFRIAQKWDWTSSNVMNVLSLGDIIIQ